MTALRFVESGSTVTIYHPGHPRDGQTVTVLRPVDRGELTGRLTAGVWVTADRVTECAIAEPHCQNCGSTSYEDLHTGDQGYTACCNEPVEYGPCDQNHDRGTETVALWADTQVS